MFKVLLMLIAGIFLSIDAFAQQITVKGIVKDTTGEPVIGANVVVKGTTNGTVTDIDGNFSIEADPKSVLNISYIGYLSKEIVVGNQKTINVVLLEDTKTLDEVVVIGYGTQKKADLTGSVANVSTDDLNTQSNTTIGQALQGKIAGVDICGEADAEAVHENEANDYANEKLLEVFEGLFGKSDCE